MKNIIDAKGIRRTFHTGEVVTRVLKGVDISVAKGEYIAIMGKSGAGKSTLLYQLSALDEPSEGTLFLDGVNVLELSEKMRTRFRLHTLGFVFQDYALVPDLSARENVMMPLLMRGMEWEAARHEAERAIGAVGLPTKYENLPSQLSGGEQQRIAIARALAGKPKIIFADEPTANLDSISGTQIIELMGQLHKQYNLTIVLVTHEDEYTRDVNRILDMEDGLIVGERMCATSPTRPARTVRKPTKKRSPRRTKKVKKHS